MVGDKLPNRTIYKCAVFRFYTMLCRWFYTMFYKVCNIGYQLGGGEGMLGTLFTEQKTNYLFFLTKGRDKDFLKVLYGMGMYQYE